MKERVKGFYLSNPEKVLLHRTFQMLLSLSADVHVILIICRYQLIFVTLSTL